MIIIFKSSQDLLEKSVQLNQKINLETLLFTNELKVQNKKVFWTCMNWCADNKIKLFNPFDKSSIDSDYENLDKIDDVILFKHFGSAEAQISKIKQILDNISKNPNMRIINKPTIFTYGFDKQYYLDLANHGFPTIPTDLYSNNITFNELKYKYENLSKYLIKPTTGELSNSVSLLANIDENWLRYKEQKVENWFVQEFQNDIWNGEYQMVFFGNTLSHAHKKSFQRIQGSLLPSNKLRKFYEYQPKKYELELALKTKFYFEDKLSYNIDYFRFDFIKDKEGNPKILEFEMVNPGFFLMYYPFEKSKQISNHFIKSILKDGDLNMKEFNIILKLEGDGVSHSFFERIPEFPVQVNILNAGKSQYAKGWNNYAPFESTDGVNWQRSTPGNFDGKKFSFIANNEYVSWYPPYSENDLKNFAKNNELNIKYDDNKLPIICLGNYNKKSIVILNRQHPGESIGSYFIEGIISELLKNKELLENYNWIIYPIVNISGLRVGNHRLSMDNIDLNRQWNSKNTITDEIKKSLPKNIFMILDIHGDEISKKNTIITQNFDFFKSPNFINIKPQSILKRFIKSLIRDKKIKIIFGKTAQQHFYNMGIDSATIELSAHLNDLANSEKIGREFLNLIKNKTK